MGVDKVKWIFVVLNFFFVWSVLSPATRYSLLERARSRGRGYGEFELTASVIVKVLPAPVYMCRGVSLVRSCAGNKVTGAVLPFFPM